MDDKERCINNIAEMLKTRMRAMPLPLLQIMEEDIETIGGGIE